MTNRIIAIGVALAIIGTIIGVTQCGKKKAIKLAVKQTNEQTAFIVHHQFDSVQYYRDLLNREHATNVVLEGTIDVLNAMWPKKMDSMARNFNVKVKQLQQIIEMNAAVRSTTTSVITPIIEQNQLIGYGFPIDDSFIVGQGIIDSSITKITLDYHAYFNVNYSLNWNRPLKIWFIKFKNFPFAKQRFKIDAYSDNNKVHITKLSAIRITH